MIVYNIFTGHMSFGIGRKLKKLKSKCLLLYKFIFPENLYIFILYILCRNKFKSKINSLKDKTPWSENLDEINKFEYKLTSQNNEDGIIDYLVNNISNPDNTFCEIGIDFYEFNSLNLIKNNWKGLLIENDELKCDKLKACLKKFYNKSEVIIKNSYISYDNLNNIISENINKKDFDILSIDIDGMEYWVLECLEVNPKIICVEFNPWMGKNDVITVPKFINFTYRWDYYYGASILAFTKLLKKKNYKLVAIDSTGTNAFFIIQKYFKKNIIEINPQTSFKYDKRFDIKKYKDAYIKIKNRELVYL